MTIQMILNKRKDISNRIDIVKSRVARAFLRTKMDSIVPPNFDEAKLVLTQFKNAFVTDSTNSADAIYRMEKDVSMAERQLRNEYNLLRSYGKSYQ